MKSYRYDRNDISTVDLRIHELWVELYEDMEHVKNKNGEIFDILNAVNKHFIQNINNLSQVIFTSVELYKLVEVCSYFIERGAERCSLKFLSLLLSITNFHRLYLWNQESELDYKPRILRFWNQDLNDKRDNFDGKIIYGKALKEFIACLSTRREEALRIAGIFAQAGLDVTSMVELIKENLLNSENKTDSSLNFDELKESINFLYKMALFFCANDLNLKRWEGSPLFNDCRKILDYVVLHAFNQFQFNAYQDLNFLLKFHKVLGFYAQDVFFKDGKAKIEETLQYLFSQVKKEKGTQAGRMSSSQHDVFDFIRNNLQALGSADVIMEQYIEPGYLVDMIMTNRHGVKVIIEYDGEQHRERDIRGRIYDYVQIREDRLREYLMVNVAKVAVIRINSHDFQTNISFTGSLTNDLKYSNLLTLIDSAQVGTVASVTKTHQPCYMASGSKRAFSAPINTTPFLFQLSIRESGIEMSYSNQSRNKRSHR